MGFEGGPSSRLSLLLLSLPGLAAVAALLFTWLQVSQTSKELRISEEGQITNRFSAAIGNLGSGSIDVRLGGIYALERIMNDSARDQATVVSVLSAYVRRHAPIPTAAPMADISAAMNVLVRRRPESDQGLELDLSRTDLRGWKPAHPYEEGAIHLQGTIFTGADLSDAQLGGADLSEANLEKANLSRADLSRATLTGAVFEEAQLRDTGFTGADLTDAVVCSWVIRCPDLTGSSFAGADLTRAGFVGADLRRATMCSEVFLAPVGGTKEAEAGRMCATLRGARLSDAKLSEVDLARADLSGADLTDADLSKADLTDANLTGAILTGTKLSGATLKGARGLPPSLR